MLETLELKSYLFTANFAINNSESEVAPYLALTKIADAKLPLLESIEEKLTEKKDEDTLAMVSKLIEDLIEDDMEAEKVFRQAVKNFIDNKIEEEVVERAMYSGSIAQA